MAGQGAMTMAKGPHPLIVKLEEVRAERGLSRIEMARRLGVSASSYTRMANNGMQPNINLIPVAASAFPEIRFFLVERLLISTNQVADMHAEAV